jgi:hypothetical protein
MEAPVSRTASKKRQVFTEEDAAQLDPAILDACAEDSWTAIKTFYKVNDKDSNLVPVDIPEIIRQHWEASGEISLWLKGRQRYLTTSVDAIFYHETIERDGLNVWALNLTEDKALENMKRVLDFDTYRHPALKELVHSVRTDSEVGYEQTRSLFKAVTIKNESTPAQADQVARTATCRRVRWTEAAFSRHYTVVKKAILDTMPRTNRKLVIETTGNGGQGGFWIDYMQVVNYGRPHPTLPHCWVLGNVTAHFLPWFTHHEYVRAAAPFDVVGLDPTVRRVLEESDREHVEDMQQAGMSAEAIEERLNWMHVVLYEEKNLLTDPQGAVRNFNREHPSRLAHAFQATGSSWFSINRIATMREFWKKENDERRLPISIDLILGKDGNITEAPGNEFLMFEPPVRSHLHRYCGVLDPASGSDDGDPTAGGILDRHLMKWAAIFHGPYPPRRAAEMLRKLGLWYFTALLNWENNSLGISCTEALLELQYPNLFKMDPKRTDISAYGWHTGPESRKEILGLAKVAFDHPYSPIHMPYLKFYDEAAAFQCPPGKPDRPEAQPPAHDDLVMMYAIGAKTHQVMPALVPIAEVRKAQPGEASLLDLAQVQGPARGGYRDAVKRRRGMRNF